MAVFLFEDASTAVRNASMRKLLDQGAEPNDLRSLEDLVNTLPGSRSRPGRTGRSSAAATAAGAAGRPPSCASGRPTRRGA